MHHHFLRWMLDYLRLPLAGKHGSVGKKLTCTACACCGMFWDVALTCEYFERIPELP